MRSSAHSGSRWCACSVQQNPSPVTRTKQKDLYHWGQGASAEWRIFWAESRFFFPIEFPSEGSKSDQSALWDPQMSIVHSAQCHRTTLLLIPWHCSPWCPGNEGHSAWLFDLEMLGSWSLNSQTAGSVGAARNLLRNQVFGFLNGNHLLAMAALAKHVNFCKRFINFLKSDEVRSFSNYPIGVALSTHFLGLVTWESSSLCLSCFWLLHALRGNASAGNCFFFLSDTSLSPVLGVEQNRQIVALTTPSYPQLQGTKSPCYWGRKVVNEMLWHNIGMSGSCHTRWWLWLLRDESSGVETFTVNCAPTWRIPWDAADGSQCVMSAMLHTGEHCQGTWEQQCEHFCFLFSRSWMPDLKHPRWEPARPG